MFSLKRQSANAETFRPVPGYADLYEVSNLGRVLSIRGDRHRFLRCTRRPDGYHCVSLCCKDGGRKWLVHRPVLTVFVGPQPPSIQAAHLNGDRSNNALANLVWATQAENERHKILHGRDPRGERNGSAKLTVEQVRAIRSAYRPRSREGSCLALGRRFGIAYQTVWDIVKRRRWAHIS